MATVRTQRDQPALEIHRFPQRYASDFRRVITRPFIIGGVGRVYSVLDRVMRLDESEVETLLEEVYAGFSDRHANIVAVFEEHYRQAMAMLPDPPSVTPARRLLLGSYFSMEYSIEAAALFNPSITPHPDQADLPEGAVRFVLSLRATGEGHLSSIVFRTGLLHADGELSLDPLPRHIARTRVATDKRYDKALFRRKLDDMHLRMDLVDAILHRLDDQFTLDAMEQAIHGAMAEIEEPLAGHLGEVADAVRWLAHANYTLRLPSDAAVSDLVIFPHTENESRGIEDLRLVRFEQMAWRTLELKRHNNIE